MLPQLLTVAEEGLIATEPPVDRVARAAAFRETLAVGGPPALWTLTDADGRVVGTAGVHESVPGVLSLGMAILRHARGRGGGRALMETALAGASALRAHKIVLEVWPENARAISLYAGGGFEVEGLRRDHYRRRDGTLRSSLLMARRIGT